LARTAPSRRRPGPRTQASERRTGPRTEIWSLRTTKDQGQGQHLCSYVCCLSMLENHFSTFYPKHQKCANLPKPRDVHPRKSSQLQGGLRPPDPLTRGYAPGPRWGLCPQTPVIGSRSRARHVPPQTKALDPPLVEFLLSVIDFFLSLTVDALQGKMCQNSLPSGGGKSLGAKISGGRGRPWGIFCFLQN